MKPTYGRLPRTGTFPFCDSLDHVGPFATSTADLARTYDALQGHDASDPVCARASGGSRSRTDLAKGLDGLRIASATGYFRTDAEPGALAALERAAKAAGANDEIEIPGAAEARAAAFLITNCEGSALHLANLRRRPADFDPDTRDRFLAGAMLPASWYVAAQRYRRVFQDTMAALFERYDCDPRAVCAVQRPAPRSEDDPSRRPRCPAARQHGNLHAADFIHPDCLSRRFRCERRVNCLTAFR